MKRKQNYRLVVVVIAAALIFVSMTVVGICYSGWRGHEKAVNLNTSYSSVISPDDVNTDNATYTEAYKFTVPKDGTVTLYIECNSSKNYAYMNYAAYRWYDSSNYDAPIASWNYYDYGIDPMTFSYSSARGVYYGERSIELGAGTYYLTLSMKTYANDSFPYSFNLKYAEKQVPVPSVQPSKSSQASVTTDLPYVKIVKPKAAKKAATVKWKKVSKKNLKKIKKVQIQYSMDSSFNSGVKTTTANAKKTSKKIKGLVKGKKYYIRVRGLSGNHVSAWSSVKSVKVK